MKFVQKSGSWSVTVGGRSDTPILELPNITKGNRLVVTATFLAKTNGNQDSGFNYTVQCTKPTDAQALSAQQSVVQGNAGWQTTTKTVFFEAIVSSQTGVEEVDFEVTFQKGDLDGQGEISDFLLTGTVISTMA
ncbi:MAG: hypothetical protein QNK37_09920 [Acidobacteriota bacterium]|nr:hypothetical protein [Acidobacteriota bacterium]